MRISGVCGVLVGLVAIARADDKPVDLTVSVPTTIAVSSTVDNTAIKPEHIADGKLDTAWNSKTGDLAPHVFVRVPAGVKVTSIKLTAGFTKVDKKLGDLFTMNPRIKKVRVSAGGKSVEHQLDITSRSLQELPIDLPPGDLDIAVLASEPGTKKKWREISISELQVWGIAPQPKNQRPTIRLGSLDALPVLTKAECAKIIGKVDGTFEDHDEIAVSSEYTVCRIDSKVGEGETEVTLAVASRSKKRMLGTPLTFSLENGTKTQPLTGDEYEATGSVELALRPLRTTEMALEITEESGKKEMHSGSTSEKTTLYRVGADGFDELVSWTTTREGGVDHDNGTDCTGPTWTVAKSMPKKLKVSCVQWFEDYHNEDPGERGRKETKDNQVYVWDGTSYK